MVKHSNLWGFYLRQKCLERKKVWCVQVEIHSLWCLVSQEVNFKPCRQYTNEMQSVLFSLKVFMSLYPLNACHFTQPGAQPWNLATKCKINGQSKQHIHNFNALTALTRHSQAIVHTELSAHTAPMFPQLVNADSNKENLWLYSLGTDHEIQRSLIQSDGVCCSGLPWDRANLCSKMSSGCTHLE